jgi:hypothetical protein
MTNDPANIAAALRTLALYAVCAVLAIIIGVLMTNPWTYTSLGFVGLVLAVLLVPVLLKWHQPLLIFCWFTPIMMFFIKGNPNLSLVMITISLVISVTERALGQTHFLNVPRISWPLFALIGVVLITAKLTGGLGLRAFGSEVYGGKKYIFLVVGILGYFALTARPIPLEKAQRYVSLFFLGGTLSCIQDFYQIMPGLLRPVYLLIPPLAINPEGIQFGTTRLSGTGWAATAFVSFLIARYGIRGIFLSGKLWRPAVFFISIVLIFVGGFRSALLFTGLIIVLQFFLEGMHRTKLMPFFVASVLAFMAVAIPLGSKLPFTFQRTLAILPESWIHLSPDARLAAQDSTDWRIQMWQGLLPQIPKYLLVGKGYAISMEDFAVMGNDSAFRSADAGEQALALSGDYHNGPLSVIIPFGIWGAIAFVWFTVVSLHAMYRNFRYGDPALRIINTFLFTSYIVGTFGFYFIVGGLASGMLQFAGLLGLSVAINRGVCRAPAAVPAKVIPFNRFKNIRRFVNSPPRPALQNKALGGPSR